MSECSVASVVSDSATLWTVCSLPGSSVHGILQARILEWVAVPFSRGSSRPRDRTPVSYISCIGRWVTSPALGGGFFSPSATGEVKKAGQKAQKSTTQLCKFAWFSPLQGRWRVGRGWWALWDPTGKLSIWRWLVTLLQGFFLSFLGVGWAKGFSLSWGESGDRVVWGSSCSMCF